jgi:hypothetical protein
MKSAQSLCIFIHFSTKAFLTYPVQVYLEELSRFFDDLILVTNDREIQGEFPANLRLFKVQNEGYDVGMFYKVFQSLSPEKYTQIACVNDSNILIHTLDQVFKNMHEKDGDLFSMIDSYEKPWFSTHSDNYHLQSHFLIFGEKAIALLPEFFKKIKVEELFSISDVKTLRRKVINDWEIGLSQFMLEKGLKLSSFIDSADFCAKNKLKKEANLSHKQVEKLLSVGYPLIKKKVVINKSFWSNLISKTPKPERLIRKFGNPAWDLERIIVETKN